MRIYSNITEQPFLDCKGVIAVLGNICCKEKAYMLMKNLLSEKDEKGNPLVDKERMPNIGKIIVPTDIFCKRYGIKRTKKQTPKEE